MAAFKYASRAVVIALTLLATASGAFAEDATSFPSRSIAIKVPFAAGGAADILARTVAQSTSVATGWNFYIENVTGAGGLVGAQSAAHSPPDGYTLLVCNIACVANQFIMPTAKWDARLSLDPVVTLGYLPNVLAVGPSLPANNVAEFVARARANPEGVAIASSGPGSSSSMTAALFAMKANIKLREIPYRGSAAAIPDLIAGRVDAMFMGVPESLPLIKDGKVKPLAVTSSKRASSLPQVPTMDEAGVAGYQFLAWSSFFVPKGTPRDIVAKLNAGFNQALKSPQIRARFDELGVQSADGTVDWAGKLLDDDISLWGPLLREQSTSGP